MLPYWESDAVPGLVAGNTVLMAAHGNSLRALVKHLDPEVAAAGAAAGAA